MRKIIPVLMFSVNAFGSILPENNAVIPLNEKNEGLSELQYNRVIDRVEATYRPVIEKMGKKLTINRLWTDPRVNAGTTKKGNEIIINMYGGYARHKLVTEDGFALVMCHELGHHLGGAPRKIYDSTGEIAWPSVEGQADYFATLKCLRKVFRSDDNEAIISKSDVPAIVREKCSEPFKELWEKALCMRTTLAGISVGNISAEIRNTEQPLPDTPDQSMVDKTYEAHPVPQCRLDTYFQGSICEISSGFSVSASNELQGTCHTSLGHKDGVRPLCWFRPTK